MPKKDLICQPCLRRLARNSNSGLCRKCLQRIKEEVLGGKQLTIGKGGILPITLK